MTRWEKLEEGLKAISAGLMVGALLGFMLAYSVYVVLSVLVALAR